MQIGDLVVFRSDTVPGIIVATKRLGFPTEGMEKSLRVERIGILWIDCNDVCWEPAEYLKVISETDNENR